MVNCKNCGQNASGNFCAHCGQSTKVDKINFSNFLKELSDSIFQVNKGLFYSLKELFVRPGHSIREYLDGKRKNHFKPVAYAFTLSTIYFLLSQLLETGTFMNDFIEGYSNGLDDPEEEVNELANLQWFAKNYAYTMLLLLPLFSLASFLAFAGAGFNYLEHLVLNAYITGQQAVLYLLSAIFSLVTRDDNWLAALTLFLSTAYVFYVFWQFFSEKSRVAVVLRSVLTYGLYITMLLLFIIFLFFTSKL